MNNTCYEFKSRFLTFTAILSLAMVGQQALAKEEAEPNEAEVVESKTASLKMPEALRAEGFLKFAEMIEAAGLTEEFIDDGPFTCFAPTDEAVKAMSEEIAKKITDDPKGEFAVAWIKYHFVKGFAYKQEHLMKAANTTTIIGRPLVIWVTPGKITMNRKCLLTRMDIQAANGIIHETNEVLDAEDEGKVHLRKPVKP